MRRRTLRSHRVPSFRARLAVEQFEDRVPVAESLGIGITMRALSAAAQTRLAHLSPTRIDHLVAGSAWVARPESAKGVLGRTAPSAAPVPLPDFPVTLAA